jgi:hypothetical protein
MRWDGLRAIGGKRRRLNALRYQLSVANTEIRMLAVGSMGNGNEHDG